MQVLAQTETHINKDLDYGTLGFVSKPRQSGSGGGGGVKIYMQKHLIWKRWSDLERDKIEGIVVETMSEKAKSFYIFIMCRAPDLFKCLYSKFNILRVFLNLLSQLSLKECILLGDFNVNLLKRTDNSQFTSTSQLFGFTQFPPNRITSDKESLIDIIASKNCDSLKDTTVVPCGITDHELIGCLRKFNHMNFPEKTVTCRDYRMYDPTKLREHLRLIGT